jgi:hypothetical protein
MKKSILSLSLLSVMGLSLFSCAENEQESQVSNVAIHARAVAVSETGDPSQKNIAGASLINFHVGFRDMSILHAGEQASTNIPIEGEPVKLRLLNNQLPQVEFLGSTSLRNAEYDRVSLRLVRGTELSEDNVLYHRTLYIDGSVNGSHLQIFTDVEEIMTVHLLGGPYTINSDEDLFLNFDLNSLLANIDLTQARDQNGDGVIEIEPTNKDGNREIYYQIINNLENSVSVTRE